MEHKISRRAVLLGISGIAALSATAGVGYLALKQLATPSASEDPHHLLTYAGDTAARRAAWSPDSARVASIGWTDTAVQVWSATTGKKLLTCVPEHTDTTTQMSSLDVAWPTDGKTVLAIVGEVQQGYAFMHTAQVWDAATGQHLRTTPLLQADQAKTTAWDLNTRYLAVATQNQDQNVVKIWDITTGDKLSTLNIASSTSVTPSSSTPTPPSTPLPSNTPTPPASSTPTPPSTSPYAYVQEMLWAPDSGKLAVISLFIGPDVDAPSLCQIWDAPSGQMIRAFKVKDQADLIIAWSPDGRSIALGTATYDVETGRLITRYTVEERLTAQAWSPDGKRLALRSYRGSGLYAPTFGSIYIVDASSGRQITRYDEGHVMREGPTDSARKMAWSPNGKNFLVVSGSIAIWRAD